MSKFKVGDKVRALANLTDPYYSNDGNFKVGEEFTVKEVFPGQKTVALVERGQCWHESRFELVEEEPSRITNFKVGDKVRRKPDSYCFGWTVGDAPCVITDIYVRRDGTQSLTLKDVFDIGWDGYRFDLVEEVKPVVPVVPQLPGIPEGFRAVRVGAPVKGEWYVSDEGASVSNGFQFSKSYTILEKIDQPAPVEPPKPVEPVKPAKKVAPTFKVGDKVRLLDNAGYSRLTVGTVDTVVRKSADDSFNGDLLCFEGPLKRAGGMFSRRFELVTENPDDLVFQGLVPSREGIDFGWWVHTEDFNSFKPTLEKTWKIGLGWEECIGLMHGHTDSTDNRLAVMCYRKDLPVLPTTETVLFTEYVVWDNGGPKFIHWSDTDPGVENNTIEHWDHAHPTGNTRTQEVPIVKA